VRECFIDGTFVVAKKGALEWERPSGAKVRRSWQWQTELVFQSPSASRASPHEVTLVTETLDHRFILKQSEKLIGESAYDSDPLDKKLTAECIKLIAAYCRTASCGTYSATGN